MTNFRALLLVAAACLLPTLGLADTVTLNPTADAYVQNGRNAAKNYGTNTQLRAQTNTSAASNYDSYLKFDTATAVGQVTSAKLRLYASLSKAGNVSSSVNGVADTGWGETTITWNNKPALGSVLGSLSTTSTSYAWKEIDVTAYVQSEKAAGRNVISLGLHNTATSSVYMRANSREATSNRPELVIVSAAANVPPTVSLISPANGSTSVSGQALVIEASAADSDGSVAQVEFLANGASLFTVTGLPYKLTTSLAAGSYALTAKATDNLGAVTTSAPVNITVTPAPNVPPTVSMTGPADGSAYAPPATIQLSADASDSDGSIAAVEFYDGGTLIGSVSAPPYVYTWSNVPAGNYSVRARAIDDRGGATYSNTIAVNVNAAVASGVYYIYADHLNTPRVITDSSNKVVWRWDSDPFGTDAANEDPDGDGAKFRYNLRFPGQYYDKETGLHYNYFRDYEPGTGRYVQSDPIGLKGGLNTYGYVGGNPISFTDPLGLLEWTGTFDLKGGGVGKIGGVRGVFVLTSECDIDGNQGFATIQGYSGNLGVGIPMSQTRGKVTFEDGHIRANPLVFNGRFTVDSIGVQIGPIGLGKTTIRLGETISTDISAAGIDAGIQFGFYGRAEVTSHGTRQCGCKTK